MTVGIVLTQAEMGEIALKCVQWKLLSESVPMDANKIRREIGNTAKAIGIPQEKALQFVKQILEATFEKMLLGLSK